MDWNFTFMFNDRVLSDQITGSHSIQEFLSNHLLLVNEQWIFLKMAGNLKISYFGFAGFSLNLTAKGFDIIK